MAGSQERISCSREACRSPEPVYLCCSCLHPHTARPSRISALLLLFMINRWHNTSVVIITLVFLPAASLVVWLTHLFNHFLLCIVCEPPCGRLTSLQYIVCFESQSRTADPELYFHLQTYSEVRLGLRLSVMDLPCHGYTILLCCRTWRTSKVNCWLQPLPKPSSRAF